MKEIKHIIKDVVGLHARPCGEFVKLAKGFSSNIDISLGEKKGDGKSILGLMKLTGKQNDEITITISGDDEENAYNSIVDFLKDNF